MAWYQYAAFVFLAVGFARGLFQSQRLAGSKTEIVLFIAMDFAALGMWLWVLGAGGFWKTT
jgi:hypothetical protein